MASDGRVGRGCGGNVHSCIRGRDRWPRRQRQTPITARAKLLDGCAHTNVCTASRPARPPLYPMHEPRDDIHCSLRASASAADAGTPGTDKCAIAEMRGPIRTLGQGSQPGDNGANDLSSLIKQNTLRLDGSHANRCAGALKSGEFPLDVLTASNIAFDFTENSSEVAESLRQVTQTDRVTLEGDGQRIRHLADSFVGASARLTGPGQARRGGDHARTEEGEPSQRAL